MTGMQLDAMLTVIGVIYGVLLIFSVFMKNRFTEAMRIDALMLANPTQNTRILNLIAGLLILGYMIYSLLA